jgi:DNA-binding SARP family transcriptional activator
MIEIRILGPLALLVDGALIPLGPRQRVLLIALLLARGRAVSAVRLADLLWAGDPPAAPGATLRSHIRHLRRALTGNARQDHPSSVLTTERLGGGFAYALRGAEVSIDADEFERLVISGRRALLAARYDEASDLLGDALALWRGQPLADVGGMRFALAQVMRLQEMHRAARMAEAEADVHRGLCHKVIAELEAMVAEEPDDEALRELLVHCLYQSGRTARAAQVCRTGMEILLAQGLDTTRLQGLQRQILGPPARFSVPSSDAC